ncbi:MAG TPA: NUDIX hydrolase [Acidimicrobiia bacterium]
MVEPIKAAGGVVLRTGADGPEVLIIHRPRYDDWTLPKGKNDPGEPADVTARREVGEETGVRTRVIGPLGTTQHVTGDGRKEVTWFAMRASGSGNGFIPNEEVDQIEWIPAPKAPDRLTYEADRDLLARTEPVSLLATGTLFLVRHGAAGDRDLWEDDDRLRPLSNKGQRQAKGIATLLADREIDAIVSSPYVRCVQTVEPLAGELEVPVEVKEALAEGTGGKEARELVRSLVGKNAVLCSHGDVIPELLDWMSGKGMTLKSAFDCKKGSTWEVDVRGGEFRRARYLPPPG